MAFIIGTGWGAVQIRGQGSDPEPHVRERISAFWTAMQKEDYATAAQYMHPESRDLFMYKVPKSRIDSWRIEKLEFNQDRTVCDAVILVRKPVAIFSGQAMEWPVSNQWVLSGGEWYFKVSWDPKKNAMLDMFRGQQAVTVQTTDLRKPEPRSKPAPSGAEVAAVRSFTPDPANPSIVRNGQKAVLRYHYANHTPSAVKIVSVLADCHCTSVGKDYPEVAPGERGTIEVTLDTFGLPLGQLNKEVHVTFADLPDPISILVSVTNEPNFVITPATVEFGAIAAARPAQKTIRILNQSGHTVRFLSSLNSDPKMEVTIQPAVVSSGEAATVELKYESAETGEFLGSLMLQTDLAIEPLITVGVRGKVDPR